MKNKFKSIFVFFVVFFVFVGKVSANNVFRIALTGGNCAGKSSCLVPLKEHFEAKGYNVRIINEVATEMYFQEGITAANSVSRYEYQKEIAKRQLKKEAEANSDILEVPKDKDSLIICDRGLLDGQAFMEDVDFFSILSELGMTESDARDRYDAVFHLISVARYNPDLYGSENNAARKEKIGDAIMVDDRLKNIWSFHRYYKVIENFPTFNEKVEKLIAAVEDFILKFGDNIA